MSKASARIYVLTRIWGAPAALSIYVILGWFLGLQNTRATLYVQLWMNGLNIVLDVVFVVGFGWGVFRVALATVIAEFAGLGLALWLMRRALRADRRAARLGPRAVAPADADDARPQCRHLRPHRPAWSSPSPGSPPRAPGSATCCLPPTRC